MKAMLLALLMAAGGCMRELVRAGARRMTSSN